MTQYKNAQGRHFTYGFKHVFVCHVKVSTEVSDAGQSPGCTASQKTVTKQEESHHAVPSLVQRFSNFNAY